MLGLEENPPPDECPAEGVIDEQKDHSADYGHKYAVEVDTSNAGFSERLKHPAAEDCADNAKQDIENDSFTAVVHQVAGDETGDQSQEDPREE